jgi:hypothetical protein
MSTNIEKESKKWMLETTRFEKLDYIMETASIEFRDNFINEIVNWMGNDDFNQFFNHLKRHYDIMTPPELDHKMFS